MEDIQHSGGETPEYRIMKSGYHEIMVARPT